jgi:hypothetical protein
MILFFISVSLLKKRSLMVCKRNLTAAQHLHLAEFPFIGLRKNLTLFGNDIVSWRRVFNYDYDPFFFRQSLLNHVVLFNYIHKLSPSTKNVSFIPTGILHKKSPQHILSLQKSNI